ncbi:carbohydrate kinase family protein [Leeuwenhoekiella parthenopeia]|uniref:Carbohydrate kinase n=1 Tax=Leeuwenhoekiella parthenopeia TaxID=2890320 RepID=A0ABS8GTF3_9FLAO|nr:carbohydrate kinase [Leeuwenhoekiella parthenopeia]MCC4212935.1 carbohydrate kinase [Leeuwenhoekiella parthenopeia]
MKDSLKAVSYGEILWDVFPDGKKLGGAPLNLCLRLKSLGVSTTMISRLGTDALAEETRAKLDVLDLNQSLIQEDDELETGQVLVTLDDSGSASYEIKEPVAWDAISISNENMKAVSHADLFVFGSLAARCETSRATLKELLPQSKYAVFDVNLRAPHYKMEHLVQFMKQAQMVKMNDEELEILAEHFGIKSGAIEDQLAQLSKETNTSLICVTLGKAGAVLYKDGKLYSHPGYPTTVVDTVGAGDSFLGGLLYQLFKEESEPEYALGFACALGAMVAGKKGANPKITKDEILDKMEE